MTRSLLPSDLVLEVGTLERDGAATPGLLDGVSPALELDDDLRNYPVLFARTSMWSID